jgi:hypothetical protein
MSVLLMELSEEELEKIHWNPETTNYLCNWSLKHRYIYVETPKVACSTVKSILQRAESTNELKPTDQNDIHNRDKSPLLQPRHDIALFLKCLNDETYLKFCFVRNPYSRALSCYLDKMVNNEWERVRLAPQLKLDPNTVPSFYEFLQAINNQEDINRDIHWATQRYILQPQKIKYSYIGRFESFKSDLAHVCNIINIKYENDIVGYNVTGADNKLVEYYDDKEIKLVQTIYKNDFKLFNYAQEIIS